MSPHPRVKPSNLLRIGPYELAPIFQRRDGRYIGRYRLHGPGPARWTQVSLARALDSATAEAMLARHVSRLAGGEDCLPDDARTGPLAPEHAFRTFGEFVEGHHLPALRASGLRSFPITADQWRLHGKADLGPLRWRELTPLRLQQWIFALRERETEAGGPRRKLSPRFVRRVYSAVSAAIAHAVALGILPFHPGKAVSRWLPKEAPAEINRGKRRALSLAELDVLIGTAPRGKQGYVTLVRDRLGWAFAALQAMRPGEWRGLRFCDLTLEPKPVPHVRVERSYFGPPKTGPRIVPLHPELVPLLRWWWERGYRAALGYEPIGDSPVFPNARGKVAVNDDHYGNKLFTALSRCNLPRITAHGLRHTGATAYLSAGMHVLMVAALLGHRHAGGIVQFEGGTDDDPSRRLSASAGLSMTTLYARFTLQAVFAEMHRVKLPGLEALLREALSL